MNPRWDTAVKRSNLLKLAAMNAEAFKSVSRRDQLPFASEDGEILYRRNDYTAFEALLLIVCNDLVDALRVDRSLAAKITGSLPTDLYRRWNEIIVASRSSGHGSNAAEPILCGAVWPVRGPMTTFCGTDADLSRQMPFIRAVVTDVSRCFALLRERADAEDVPIDRSFWLTTAELLPDA